MNRILIVEDEITISRLIAVSLRRAGYDCTVANDGSTAADLIAEHDFDLALLDPPFHHDTVAAVLPLLAAKMAPGGVVLCETEREADLPEQAGTLTLVKQYNYGKIKVSRYERGEEA